MVEMARLAGGQLLLVRKRLMSKVLIVLLALGFAIVVGFGVLEYALFSNQAIFSASNSCPTVVANQTATPQPGGPPQCVTPSPQEQQQVEVARQHVIAAQRANLTFPTSLGMAGGYAQFMGLILLAILAGALVGGEYAYGTQRLAFARGAGRGQVLAAQSGALAILALVTAALTLLLGVISGVTVGPAVGGTVAGLTGAGVGEVLLYWLVISLVLFAGMLIALFTATLGRSTAAGIGGALGYQLLQLIGAGILAALGGSIPGDTGTWLTRSQYLFLGPSASLVLGRVAQSPVALASGDPNPPVASGVALIVIVGYCVVMVGLSYLLVRQRDVTT
jgi:ABC-type transport system involved in multi-copper enzyme maturation permease subunit